MQYRQACDILGVSMDASKEEAKRAYRRLANIHHPDKGGDAEKFKEVAAAYRSFVAQAPFIRLVKPPPQTTPPPPPMDDPWGTAGPMEPGEPQISRTDLDSYRDFVRRTEAADKRRHADNRWALLILLALGGIAYLAYLAVVEENVLLLAAAVAPIILVALFVNKNQLLFWAETVVNFAVDILYNLRTLALIALFFLFDFFF